MLQPHIHLDNSFKAKYALMPGDPARLDRIAPFLDNVKELAYNREYRSLYGTFKGVGIIAISTGIGGSSAGICIEELSHIGIQAMIRIGSCGALQKEINIGDLVLVNGAVRDDGASQAYIDLRYPAVPDTVLLAACIESAREAGFKYHVGLVHSHESFYIDENEEQQAYWSKRGILGADMETAALFTIGRLRGIKTASILNNVVLYGQDTADSIGDYVEGEERATVGERNEILTALNAFVKLNAQ